ncbi:MAG TPA: hypothetical protein VGJ70_08185, partial [Solirubrobacteraceae bacterium]
MEVIALIRSIDAPNPVCISSAEPLVGYDAFCIIDGRLVPWFTRDVEVDASGRLHAGCRHDGSRFGALCVGTHAPPMSWCSCGVAADVAPHPILTFRCENVASVLALVRVCGRTVFDGGGVRAQHGQVLAIARPTAQPRAESALVRAAAAAIGVRYLSEARLVSRGAVAIHRTAALVAQRPRALLEVAQDAVAPPALFWFRFGPTDGRIGLCPWTENLGEPVPVDRPMAGGHVVRRR